MGNNKSTLKANQSYAKKVDEHIVDNIPRREPTGGNIEISTFKLSVNVAINSNYDIL